MYSRQQKNYNRRSNPNTATVHSWKSPDDPAEVTYFKSVTRARVFLVAEQVKRDIDPIAYDRNLTDIIKAQLRDAEKLVIKHDKRNLRRQVKSLTKKGKSPEGILRRGNIAQQLIRLYGSGRKALGKFLSWCGKAKFEMAALCSVLIEIIEEKCSNANKSSWEEEACDEDGGRCLISLEPDESDDEPDDEPDDESDESDDEEFIIDESEDRLKEEPLYHANPIFNPISRETRIKRRIRRARAGSHSLKAAVIKGVPKNKLHKWEEVLGPRGELIRFRVDRYKTKNRIGEMRRVVRDNSDPMPGDVILDLTKGAEAYYVTRARSRTRMPLNLEMEEQYRESFLYEVRLVAVGKLTPEQFLKNVQKLVKPSNKQVGKKLKKLKKIKNNKN